MAQTQNMKRYVEATVTTALGVFIVWNFVVGGFWGFFCLIGWGFLCGWVLFVCLLCL